MIRELNVRKCENCGSLIRVINDCTCDDCVISCCSKEMKEVIANSSDGSVEKHLPNYEIENGKITVFVDHVMDSDHYIEWVAMVNEKNEMIHYFRPSEKASCTFEKIDGGILYSYCNKHGLWKKEIN